MRLDEYLDKRGINPRDLARRLGLSYGTIRKCREVPAKIKWDIIIAIVEGTSGIVSANDLLGITTRRPNYKAIYK